MATNTAHAERLGRDRTHPDRERWSMLITTGDGVLRDGHVARVHNPAACAGRGCAIHNPSDHPLADRPIVFRNELYRTDRLCPHGALHPDPDDVAFHAREGRDVGEHDCDGCCQPA